MVKSVTTVSIDSTVLMKLKAEGKNISQLCNSFLTTVASDSNEHSDPLQEMEKQKVVIEELRQKLNIEETRLHTLKAQCTAELVAEQQRKREEAITQAKAYRMHRDHNV